MNKLILISYQLNKLGNSIKKRGKVVFLGFLLSFVLNLAAWVLIYFRLYLGVKGLPSVPLHYNIYFGIDQIGSPMNVFLLPFFGLLVFILNFIITYVYSVREKLMGYVLIISTIVIEFFVLLAGVFLVLINL